LDVRLTTSHRKTFIVQKPIQASRTDHRIRPRREAWVLKEKGIRMPNIWERRILRKIYGAKKEGSEWKIWNNQELRSTY
jgi:hypothetical protein